jgi:hypothetical protein
VEQAQQQEQQEQQELPTRTYTLPFRYGLIASGSAFIIIVVYMLVNSWNSFSFIVFCFGLYVGGVLILRGIMTQVTLSPEGIEERRPFKRVFTTWDNVERFGVVRNYMQTSEVLFLRKPVDKGTKYVMEGYDLRTSNSDIKEYLRRYAPHVFEEGNRQSEIVNRK